jgi:hypothetical protein
MDREQLVVDLTPFCDIGDSAVKVSDQAGRLTVKLTRDGRPLKLVIDRTSGKIQSTWGTTPVRNFASFPAMLASEVFANLRRWSDAQRDLLLQGLPSADNLLPVHGIAHDKSPVVSVEQVDNLLGATSRPEGATEILLIDGPAGIGKTSLIEQLALRRASLYKSSSRALILHVKSRGRVLSNLQDLMAFSLQTIRSQITYDQIPVLAKHGLVVIAIDGFDELADPNGYEMAWAQLGELVIFVRGRGTLILAGRDTFIGRSRLLKDVKELRDGVDIVNGLTLSPPTPEQAKQWLSRHQWTEANFAIPSISVLLEADSFALRPVFLRILAEQVKPKDLKDKHERYLTPLLVNQMIRREAGLFGKPVEAVMDLAEREAFLQSFLCEVARQMADSQVEALEASEIAWISEAALGGDKPAEIVALIRNRASVVAFFVNDERAGYKGFMHSYLMHYFLSMVVVDAIGRGDVPKFIRRNLLGSEFLSVFTDVAAEVSITFKKQFESFWGRASAMSLSYSSADRGLRNVGALVLAALPAVTLQESVTLREYHVDDAVVRGSCPKTLIHGFEINQLDCRGADLSGLEWIESRITSMIADEAVRVSPSFPVPGKVTLLDDVELVGVDEISNWLGRRGRDVDLAVTSGLASAALKKKPIYSLLDRAARMRQYWLRGDSDDIQASKIVNDPHWPTLSRILVEHDYLRVETRQASGRSSKFFHIKHRESILAQSPGDDALRRLFEVLQSV